MSSTRNKARITRRHLPHLTTAEAPYFVTVRLRAKPLAASEVELVRNHILAGDEQYYDLTALQVMPDHFHVLLCPKRGFSLSRVMKGIKGVTARCLNQQRGSRGRLWRDESYDRIIRDQKELEEKINYMFINPVRAGLTKEPDSYIGWFRK